MTTIGHNSTPLLIAAEAVQAVWDDAKDWLGGAVVTDQEQADAVARVLDAARKAAKQVEAAHKEMKAPFLEAGKAIDDEARPIVAKAKRIADAAKEALAPWLKAQEAAAEAAKERARAEAAAALRASQEAAIAARASTDLSAQEEADRLAEEARQAAIAARVAEKAKGAAKGGTRAVTLRTVKRGEVTDLQALMRWIWTHDRSALAGWADDYVAGAIRAGQTQMDGVTVHEDKVAV